MPIIELDIDRNGADYQANCQAMLKQIDEVAAIKQKVLERSLQEKPKFTKRGKMLPHERVQHLLDAGSPFVELCGLAGYMLDDDKDGTEAGGNMIAGIGVINGVRCLVGASNSAIKGGTISPSGLRKSLRLQQIARQNKLPMVTLAESGGANLNHAADIFVEGARSFANQARLSAMGIPQITVVHGNATAGGAYQPGLSDYMVVVRGKTEMFLAGPPLLKAATGEVATEEDLGGAAMHAQVAGTAEYLAENDADGIRQARDIVSMLGWDKAQLNHDAPEPRYPIDDILGIIPCDLRKPYDVRQVIACLVDDSNFLDFKTEFDNQTICGWANIGNVTIGIIGNNGPITPQGAAKASQFIQLCDQTNRPLLFLHNTTGFMVGTESEQNGVIKHGSKMIQAVANTRVPKLSIVIGGSYGAGNYAMCGRGLDPHFIFAWPNSKTAVMGGAQAGKVLRIVTEAKQQKMGITPDENVLNFLEMSTAAKLESQSTALFNTAKLFDDGVIDPRDTRKLLVFLLQTIKEAEQRQLSTNTYGVARF